MGMVVTGSKRKRQPAVARSELDKFAHKSGVLLQREAKKVRAFLVRKGVQQLKQTRAQLEQRRRDDANAAANGVAKLTATVQRLEREHAALKALDLRAVVARVLTVTGLEKRQQERRQQQDGAESDDDDDDSGSDDYGGGGGALSDDDDGFDSEEYENARRAGDAQKEEEADDSADESDEGGDATGDEKQQQQQGASTLQTLGKESAPTPSKGTKKAEKEKEETSGSEKQSADDARLQLTLVDRVVAHKQVKALVEAIETWLANEEKENEKKLRRQEKKAFKRGSKEVLIGGRSAAAPSSLFLGSLSGRSGLSADVDTDDVGLHPSHLAGAEDDIAEFLGETKKKKNRTGQNARRQKALRMEEAAKRKQDRENGVFRPYAGGGGASRRDDAVSKYGPSERPKKKRTTPTAFNGKDGKRKQKGRESGDRKAKERNPGPGPGRTSSSSGSGGRERRTTAKVEVAHPSWLAKQALKEKEKASLGAFSGKKITFD